MAEQEKKKRSTNRKKSGIIELRKTGRRTQRNNTIRTSLEVHERLFLHALQKKDVSRSKELFIKLQKIYSKAAKNHVIHKNRAKKYISSATRKIHTSLVQA